MQFAQHEMVHPHHEEANRDDERTPNEPQQLKALSLDRTMKATENNNCRAPEQGHDEDQTRNTQRVRRRLRKPRHRRFLAAVLLAEGAPVTSRTDHE